MTFLFISGAEIVFIFFIILMIFGADRIPEIAKGMAKGIRKVKDATQEIKSEIKKSAEKKGVDTDSISKEIDKVKDKIVKDMQDKDAKVRRISTACYLIYRTAMRVGDEKDPEEADTVGATTLRKEHIKLNGDFSCSIPIKFNALFLSFT